MQSNSRILLGLLIVLAAAVTVRGAEPPAAVALPHVTIVPETRDAGIVRKGEKVEAVFEVRNTGPAPLVVSDARPSCGCTVTTFDREIAPGKTGRIHASVDTRNFDGPITKTITVVSNDPEHSQLTLTLRAEVRK